MSYILDALKKADQKRHLERRVPTLTTVHQPPALSQRRLWPWMIATVVVANAVVWLWLGRVPTAVTTEPSATSGGANPSATAAAPSLPEPSNPAVAMEPAASLHRRDTPSDTAPAASGAPAEPRSNASGGHSGRKAGAAPPPATERVESKPNASETPARSAEPEPSTKRADPTGRQKTAPLGDNPAPAVPAAATSAVPAPARSATPPSGPPPVTASAPAAPVVPAPAQTAAAAPGRAAPAAPAPPEGRPSAVERAFNAVAAPSAAKPTAPVPPPSTPPSAAPAAPSAPVAVDDSRVQDSVSKMKLQMVVYSDVPGQRLVFIDGKKYVEGESVDGKLVVESITPDSAVLGYQGRRFVIRQ